MKDQIHEYLMYMRINESIDSVVFINEYFFANFISIGLFVEEYLDPTTIPLLVKQLISKKQYCLLERAIMACKERSPALNFVLAVCKSFKGDILGFQKYFGNALAEINNYNEEKCCVIEEHIFNNSEYDAEFTESVKNVNNPMIVFAKS